MSERKFNFTLREVFFAMVAVAALAALINEYRNSPPTDLPNDFLAKVLVGDAQTELGVTSNVMASSSGGGGSRRDFESHSEAVFGTKDKSSAFQVMEQARQNVLAKIKAQNCKVSGTGWSGENEKRLTSFSFSYTRGKTKGKVFVRMYKDAGTTSYSTTNNPVEHWTMWVNSYEYCR